MPLEENIETYRYFISEADKLNLSYITLRRYSPLLDAEFDGSSFASLLSICLILMMNNHRKETGHCSRRSRIILSVH